MRVLITGGSGFIGTNAVEAFAAAGHDVCNLSHRSPLETSQTPLWREGDVLDARGTAEALAEFQPEWVIHLAARAEWDENTTVETGYR